MIARDMGATTKFLFSSRENSKKRALDLGIACGPGLVPDMGGRRRGSNSCKLRTLLN